MLQNLIEALRYATTEKEIERAYKNLEKVGMDRVTARLLVKEMTLESLKLRVKDGETEAQDYYRAISEL